MMTSKSKVEDKLMKKWTRWGLGIFVVAGLWVAAVSSQAAGPYYWDVNDTSGGFGTAGGTWGTSAYWNTDSTGGSGGTLANTTITTADDVNFGTGANGLAGGTVNGPASAQGFLNMTFGAASGAITLSGGTLNLAPSSTITVNNTADTISAVLQGSSSALVKEGSGKLTLSGANSYSGVTTIKAGSLSIASAVLGTNTVTLDGGELDVTTTPWSGTITNAIAVNSGGGTINASSITKVLMGSITGSGALSVKGTTSTGFLWMKDCTGYNGAMTISTGYALFQSTGTNGNAGAAFTVNATALMIDCGNSLNTIFNMGSLAGTGNIYASGYNLDAGKIKTLSVGGLNADTTFSGVLADEISGTTAKLALTKIGTGTFTLAGTNTYSGGTTVSNGALLVNGVVTGQMMVAVGGTLGGTGVVAGVVTNNGAISAGATNTTGVLTVSNLVMAANSAYFYNYDATTNDVIAVTGNLTLPTVTTVKVSRVSGAAPIANPAVLFSASSAPAGATSLDGWVVTGDVRSDSRVVIRGNQVQLVRSTGMLLEIY
jgi:autotransporter-associated beta strand protein